MTRNFSLFLVRVNWIGELWIQVIATKTSEAVSPHVNFRLPDNLRDPRDGLLSEALLVLRDVVSDFESVHWLSTFRRRHKRRMRYTKVW